MYVEKEPCRCFSLSAICAIDRACKKVDKGRRAVTLHGRKLMICLSVNFQKLVKSGTDGCT